MTASTTDRMPMWVNEIGVVAGLRDDAVARVDEHHRKIGSGGAGHDVARVLLVAGGVGDDEFAPVGGEETVGASMVMPCSRSAASPSTICARSMFWPSAPRCFESVASAAS